MKSVLFCIVSLCLFSSVSFAMEAPKVINGAETVPLRVAKQLYDDGAIFIDVRDPQSWSFGHILGSVNLDVGDTEFTILYVSEKLNRNTPIVFYNSSPLDFKGALASQFAVGWGYKNVYYFREGFYSWMAADLPVELMMAHKNGGDHLVSR